MPAKGTHMGLRPISVQVRFSWGWLTLPGLLVAWQALLGLTGWPEYLLPGPATVAKTLVDDAGLWVPALASTLTLTAVGFALALVFALALGVALDSVVVLEQLASPLILLSQTIPVFFLYPLLLILLGFGPLPLIVVVFLACFFPLLISFLQGLKATSPAYLDLFRTLGASRWATVTRLKFPWALPSLVSGLRLAVAYALSACVLGEYLGAREGLGVYMARAYRSFAPARVLAAIVVVSAVTWLLFQSVKLIESRFQTRSSL
jgi:ABC-type nitrate/sulfonate/bicarbonate transport system permease component